MDDSQSESLWSHLRHFLRGRENGESHLAKAIAEAKEEGDVAGDDAEMLFNVLRLAQTQVEDVMIPRPDMVCAELSSPILDVVRLFVEHGHSRMPVYKHDKDNIVGLVYVKDVLPALVPDETGTSTDPDTPAKKLRSMLRPVLFVPESRNIRDMLKDFLARGTHMAIVLDAYGGTAGVVTLEDVLEEIVGDIRDEHDQMEPEEFRFEDGGVVLVAGRATLEDVAEVLDLHLESDQVDTLGGYLSDLAGQIPRPGQSFTLLGRTATVREADRKQVHWVAVEPEPAAQMDSRSENSGRQTAQAALPRGVATGNAE